MFIIRNLIYCIRQKSAEKILTLYKWVDKWYLETSLSYFVRRRGECYCESSVSKYLT